MRSTPLLLWLYLLNAAALITHEIDSAYWHEWALFGILGGIQVFLGLNLVLVIVILYGHQALALGRASGFVLKWSLRFQFSDNFRFLPLSSPGKRRNYRYG